MLDLNLPEEAYLSDVGRNRLTFSWAPVLPNCASIRYRIMAVNCGVCPGITYKTSVNCTALIQNNININVEQVCMFSVKSVVCGDFTETANSVIITTLLKGKFAMI